MKIYLFDTASDVIAANAAFVMTTNVLSDLRGIGTVTALNYEPVPSGSTTNAIAIVNISPPQILEGSSTRNLKAYAVASNAGAAYATTTALDIELLIRRA
jgi:hypothetical protein